MRVFSSLGWTWDAHFDNAPGRFMSSFYQSFRCMVNWESTKPCLVQSLLGVCIISHL